MPLFLSFAPFFPQMTYFAFSSQSFSMFSSYRWDQYKLVEDDHQPSMLLITSMFGSCWLFHPDSILRFFPPPLEPYLLLIAALDLQRLKGRSMGSVVEGRQSAIFPLLFPCLRDDHLLDLFVLLIQICWMNSTWMFWV